MSWELTYTGARPWTVNAERSWNMYARAKTVKEWRTAFAVLALEARMPRPIPGPVVVVATPLLRDLRTQDAGACYVAVKAAVDGLVDAGVLPDDGPKWVQAYVLVRPQLRQDCDGLRLEIKEIGE